eukprot:111026_1
MDEEEQQNGYEYLYPQIYYEQNSAGNGSCLFNSVVTNPSVRSQGYPYQNNILNSFRKFTLTKNIRAEYDTKLTAILNELYYNNGLSTGSKVLLYR